MTLEKLLNLSKHRFCDEESSCALSRKRLVQNRGTTRFPRGLSYAGQHLREEIWGLHRRRALPEQEEQRTTGLSLFSPLHLSQNPSEFPSKQTQTSRSLWFTLSAILTNRLNPSEDLRSNRAEMFWQKSLAFVLDSTSKAWWGGMYARGRRDTDLVQIGTPFPNMPPPRPISLPYMRGSPPRAESHEAALGLIFQILSSSHL